MRESTFLFFLAQGRLRRRVYVGATLLLGLVGGALWFVLETWVGPGATWFVHVPLLWMFGVLAVRRLHDRDRSGLRLLLLLIPLLGPLWIVIELVCLRGTRGNNRFGADPRQRRVGYLTVS